MDDCFSNFFLKDCSINLSFLEEELYNWVDLSDVAVFVIQIILQGIESHIRHMKEMEMVYCEYDYIDNEKVKEETHETSIDIDEPYPKMAAVNNITVMGAALDVIEYKQFINLEKILGQQTDSNNNSEWPTYYSWGMHDIHKPFLFYNISWTGFFCEDVKKQNAKKRHFPDSSHVIERESSINDDESKQTNASPVEEDINSKQAEQVVVEECIDQTNSEHAKLEVIEEFIHQINAKYAELEVDEECIGQINSEQTESEVVEEFISQINSEYAKQEVVEEFIKQIHSTHAESEVVKECIGQINSEHAATEEVEEFTDQIQRQKKETESTPDLIIQHEDILPIYELEFTIGKPLDVDVKYLKNKYKTVYLDIPFKSNDRCINEQNVSDTSVSEEDSQTFNYNFSAPNPLQFETHLSEQKEEGDICCRTQAEVNISTATTKAENRQTSSTTNDVFSPKLDHKYTVPQPFGFKNKRKGIERVRTISFKPQLNHEHTNPEPFFDEQKRQIHIPVGVQFSPKLEHKSTTPQPFDFNNHSIEYHIQDQDPFQPEMKHEHTVPEPFQFIERDKYFQERKEARVQEILKEEERKVQKEVIKSYPAPRFGSPFKPKLTHKCTRPKPFSFLERHSHHLTKDDKRLKRKTKGKAN